MPIWSLQHSTIGTLGIRFNQISISNDCYPPDPDENSDDSPMGVTKACKGSGTVAKSIF